MTDHPIPVTEDELHAYVDGELPLERRGDVEAWLASHPDDAARVAAWRAVADQLHARYDSVADEPLPARLRLDQLSRLPRKWLAGAIAATLAAFIAGAGAGWFAHGSASAPNALTDLHAGSARRASALRGRSAPSGGGRRQRTRASAAVAVEAARLSSQGAAARGHRPAAGRRTAVAGAAGAGGAA